MWYIMSYNSIQGFNSGAFSDLRSLFLGEDQSGSDCISWVPLASEAKAFPTQEEAMKYAKNIWGRPATTGLSYIFMEHEPMGEDVTRRLIDERTNVSKALAAGSLTKEELVAMTENMINNKLTYREKWIIDLLTKSDAKA